MKKTKPISFFYFGVVLSIIYLVFNSVKIIDVPWWIIPAPLLLGTLMFFLTKTKKTILSKIDKQRKKIRKDLSQTIQDNDSNKN